MSDPAAIEVSQNGAPDSRSEPVWNREMILVNGSRTSLINVLDRGLQYGDGLFETIAVVNGKPLLWERHLQRLTSGCHRLGISVPDPILLANEAAQICAGQEKCVLKIIITRGTGGRGYRASQTSGHFTHLTPTRILSLHRWPDYPAAFSQHGITLRLCKTRLGINPAIAGIKHLNRLEQVIARSEWDDPDIPEGLMVDSNGYVVEGTISNVFVVHKGVLTTPDLSGSGVDGVMRGLILDIAESFAIPNRIAQLRPDDIKKVDEIFLCNTLINIWPVRFFEGTSFDDFRITRTIAAELQKYLAN